MYFIMRRTWVGLNVRGSGARGSSAAGMSATPTNCQSKSAGADLQGLDRLCFAREPKTWVRFFAGTSHERLLFLLSSTEGTGNDG